LSPDISVEVEACPNSGNGRRVKVKAEVEAEAEACPNSGDGRRVERKPLVLPVVPLTIYPFSI